MAVKKLIAKKNHIWQGSPLVEGDSYPSRPKKAERERLIRIGLAMEVEAEPETDFPKGFPFSDVFIQAGITEFDKVKELYEKKKLQTVDQVGPSTETKINAYFEVN